jgi:hypothetical protein
MDLMRQRRQNSSYMKKKQLSLHDKAMLAMREAVKEAIKRHNMKNGTFLKKAEHFS